MKQILFVAVLLTIVSGVAALRCFTCSRVLSVRDGLDAGDVDCSDGDWNLTAANTDLIRDDANCIACVKTLTDLGPDRFEVTRTCVFSFIDYGRNQKINTCATTELKAGNYFRCVCDTDLCNANMTCEAAVGGCYDPPTGNCPACPEATCPPSAAHSVSPATLALAASLLLAAIMGTRASFH